MSMYTKIDADLKAKWIAALRSGDYKQGIGELRYQEREHTYHCCLGVLCEVADHLTIAESGNDVIEAGSTYGDGYRGLSKLLGNAVSQLWTMNDVDEKSFAQIADWIEENL